MPTVSRATELWRSLEPRAQITLAACAAGVLFTAFFLYQLGQRPNWTIVASGMSASEGADVARVLESAGIRYELREGGAVAVVEQGEETRARVQLAGEGLPNGGHVGYEIFDSKSFGATDFEQKVAYQRALEGEIARTIESVEGVRAAEVQLVLPKDALFLDDGSKPTAAVLLEGGTSLDQRAVGGIARLVASSVEGLRSDGVTITDETGALLWPAGTGGGDGAATQLDAERAYASQVTAQLDALILSTLGPGKATVRVNADLDLDRHQIDSVTYGQKPVPLETQTDSEKLAGGNPGTAGTAGTGGATGAGGVSGVAGNVPGYGAATGAQGAAAAAGNGNSSYSHDKNTTSYGVDKRVESVTVAPGTVKRLSVALVVDKGVPASDVEALRDSIAGAAGIDSERGDAVTVARVAFAERPESAPVAGSILDSLGGPVGIGRLALTGIGGLVLLLLVRKGLRRRETEPLAIEPTWLREVTEARPLAELEATIVDAVRAPDSQTTRRKQIDDQVEEILRRQPESVAQQVSQWMQE